MASRGGSIASRSWTRDPKNDVVAGGKKSSRTSPAEFLSRRTSRYACFSTAPLLQPARALGGIFLSGRALLVAADGLARLPLVLDAALAEKNPAIAHALERSARMRHEGDGLALALELDDPIDALALERFVSDGEHLVEQQDVRIDVYRDREPRRMYMPEEYVGPASQ